jgi:hypothetical protein
LRVRFTLPARAVAILIALASTAAAYSLAAVIGSIVVLVGLQAPASLIVSFPSYRCSSSLRLLLHEPG